MTKDPIIKPWVIEKKDKNSSDVLPNGNVAHNGIRFQALPVNAGRTAYFKDVIEENKIYLYWTADHSGEPFFIYDVNTNRRYVDREEMETGKSYPI